MIQHVLMRWGHTTRWSFLCMTYRGRIHSCFALGPAGDQLLTRLQRMLPQYRVDANQLLEVVLGQALDQLETEGAQGPLALRCRAHGNAMKPQTVQALESKRARAALARQGLKNGRNGPGRARDGGEEG
jgi:hypothetical protein